MYKYHYAGDVSPRIYIMHVAVKESYSQISMKLLFKAKYADIDVKSPLFYFTCRVEIENLWGKIPQH